MVAEKKKRWWGMSSWIHARERDDSCVIFALKQMMEKHREKRILLHIVFVDLEKFIHGVTRQATLRCMGKGDKWMSKCKSTKQYGVKGPTVKVVYLQQGSL